MAAPPTAVTRSAGAQPRMGFIYRGSRIVLRAAVRAYYDLHVVNRERAPKGPTLFVSNHPNSLLDPVVIGACLDRQLSFVAKSTLFRGPLGAFLRSAGAIPVYRKQDTSDTSGNVTTFASCIEVLEAGGSIGIFPEGLSHTDPQLKHLKTGAARIALETEERNGWRAGVVIEPVGLHFQLAPRLRSRVIVSFGEPIVVASLRASHERDPRIAAQELTAEIERAISGLIVHVDNLELAEMVRDVERIFAREIPRAADGAAGQLWASQEIARAVHLFMSRDPDGATGLARRIRRYLDLLDRLGIRDEVVKRPRRGFKLTRESMRLVVVPSVLLPVAIYGLLVNYVPIRAAYWSGRLLAPRASVVATARFIAGFLGVLLTYPLELYAADRMLGLEGAAIFAATLPTSGLLAVRYPRIFSAYVDRMRSVWLRLTRRRFVVKLRRRRAALLDELHRRREEYIRLRDGVETEPPPEFPV